MGKWGIQHCEACLLPLLSMPRSWLCLSWTDPLDIQWQRTSRLCKSRCRGWRGSGSHQDRDSFRGPEQRTRKVRKSLCLLIQRIHFSVVSFILSWYVFTALSSPYDRSICHHWLRLVRFTLGLLILLCSTDSCRGHMMPRVLLPSIIFFTAWKKICRVPKPINKAQLPRYFLLFTHLVAVNWNTEEENLRCGSPGHNPGFSVGLWENRT